tara:strand:- start:218 stop:508 length:291 start_codon:yes stop_codon:yes gene_type:complete
MKAKEYFKRYNTDNLDKSEEWRFVMSLRCMVSEVSDIKNKRKVKTEQGLINIFKEVYKKSKSFIRMVNDNDLKYEYRMDSLKEMIKNDFPLIYNAL